MRTKIVYDVISTLEDVYFEQVWASAWTMKHFNVDAHIILLTDASTRETINTQSRRKSLPFFDEIIVVDFDKEYTNKEKSRYIKTKMRYLVSGDFLFVDADTIITGGIEEIDKIACDGVCAVLDHHCKSKEICEFPIFKAMYIEPMNRIFGVDYKDTTDVYNSGVLLVKESEKAFEIFDLWHKNWLISREKGECRDQLALTVTCQQLANPINTLSGIFNCQIRLSVEYLYDAKIIHTFATQVSSDISKFFDDRVYRKIKERKEISGDVSDQLLNCKRLFSSPSFLVDKTWLDIRFMPAYLLISEKRNSKKYRDLLAVKMINFFARVISFILRRF